MPVEHFLDPEEQAPEEDLNYHEEALPRLWDAPLVYQRWNPGVELELRRPDTSLKLDHSVDYPVYVFAAPCY
jgi:hypothetical protein